MSKLMEDENFKALSETLGEAHSTEAMSCTLFVSLMRHFYDIGWMRGTGGAMGCLEGSQLYISPSALQKERLHETDIFMYNTALKCLNQQPENTRIAVSSCAVLFTMLMRRTGATCVIHTHSKAANLLTQIIKEELFEISHQEYIKGIWDPFTGKNLSYEDTLSIPIIDNMPSESQLLPSLEEAITINPRCCAVLVKNHGLFVWGRTWEETKIMSECIDYLLELSIDMVSRGIPLVKDQGGKIKVDSDYQICFSQANV